MADDIVERLREWANRTDQSGPESEPDLYAAANEIERLRSESLAKGQAVAGLRIQLEEIRSLPGDGQGRDPYEQLKRASALKYNQILREKDAEIERLRLQHCSDKGELTGLKERVAKQTREIEGLRAENADSLSRLEVLKSTIRELEDEVEALQEELESANGHIGQLQSALSWCRG